MLWYKGWFETRYRILLGCALMAYTLLIDRLGERNSWPLKDRLDWTSIMFLMVTLLLAGAGTKTQAPFRQQRGLHGSTLFTLTLPVSRLQLVAIRAGVGILETALIFLIASMALWRFVPAIKVHASLVNALEYAFSLTICNTVAYFVCVLVAIFLDDVWQIWGKMISVAALLFISSKTPRQSLNLQRAIGSASPFVTHALPWTTMGYSLLASAILFYAAVKVAEAREY